VAKTVIVGAALKIPPGFELVGEVQNARCIMKAPDGKEIELVVDVKAFSKEEFFESMDQFKEQINSLEE